MRFQLALAGVLIAGGAIGIAMPAIDAGNPPAPASEARTDAAQADAATLAFAASEQEPAWDDTYTLRREPDGHFYADVMVDGQSARMLVDTGASVIALTGEDAAAMGLSWDETEVKEVAQGANGAVYGVHTVLPRVSLGSFEAEDVPAMIIPEGLFISLLGQSFLSKIGKVEMAGDQLIMSSSR